MNSKLKRIVALAMVALMIGAVGAGAAAFDTETSTTTSTSDVTSASMETFSFDPGNESETITVQTDGFSDNEADLAVRIYPEDTTTSTVVYENTSTPEIVDATNGQYAFTIDHDELSDVPIGTETASYGLEIVNASDDTEVAAGNFTLDKTDSDSTVARIMIADEEISDSVLVPDTLTLEETDSSWLATLNVLSNDTVENKSIVAAHANIAGNGSEAVLDIEEADTQAAVDNAVADDVETGDWLAQVHVASNLNWAPTYYKEAPDEVSSDSTYAVYDPTAEEITVNHGEDFEGVSVTSIKMTANEDLGIFENWNRYNRLGMLGL